MTLQVGTAIEDISPTGSLTLVGYPNVERKSTGVHDPLLASALYVNDGDSDVLMISLDLLFVSLSQSNRLRARIEETAGISRSRTVISCTHTHSGPLAMERLVLGNGPAECADEKYLVFLEQKVLAAAAKAKQSAQAASVASTTAIVKGAGGNRHDPENGASDPEVGILVFRDSREKTIAVSVIYSMHPTVMHEDSLEASADFPGYCRVAITEKLGDDVTILYHMGPSGNQSPRYFVKGQTFDEAERLGRIVGDAVNASVAMLRAADFDSAATVGMLTTSVELPRKQFPTVARAQEDLNEAVAKFERLKSEDAGWGPIRTAECVVFGAETVLAVAKTQETGELERRLEAYRLTELSVIRIGDAYLPCLPCEIFVEYGLELKRTTDAKAFPVSLANGELQGYIVTPGAVGYEAFNSVFLPESGELMVRNLNDLIKKVR